ncbi:uncharacterized protein LOC121429133 [Lytechinus variegatus]|uniref:uncharacterized protein LOC121429133 n=1 Tax=Lytechinus variegatus TaxID=7654 RepID=UPI001BB2207F|nr:uncharacterized protein LOC121429133 [Lytechinus variegatus]
MESGRGKRPRPAKTPTSPLSSEAAILPAIQLMLNEQSTKFENRFSVLENKILKEIKLIREQCAEVVATVEHHSIELKEMKQEMEKLKEEMAIAEKENKEELDKMETYVARENLVFLNVPVPEKVTREGGKENVEETMKEFMMNKLQFTEQEVEGIEYQRIHRVQAGTSPRPIKVRYLRYADKVSIQQRANLLKNTRMYITDDLSRRVRMERRSQVEALKAARGAGKLAYFSRAEPTKLIVDHVWIPKKDQPRFIEKLGRRVEIGKDQVVQRRGIPMVVDQGARGNDVIEAANQ